MNEKIISENLVQAIIGQMREEKINAHVYLFISGFLKGKGLDNLASIFENQYKEENEHFHKFFDILTDFNVVPNIPDIPNVQFDFTSIVDIANKFLERELLTTESITEIRDLSIDESYPIAEEFLRDMISLQRLEYEEALTMVDKAELCGSNWMNVFIWDLGLKG
ncbi:MAG: ferritin-like domain-containing protein [Microgenomates group bacterium]